MPDANEFFKDFHYAALDVVDGFAFTDEDAGSVTLTDALRGALRANYPQVSIRVEVAKDLITFFGDMSYQPNDGFFLDFTVNDGALAYRKGGSVNQEV